MYPVLRRLDNGNLLVPVAGYDEKLHVYFDGMAEIDPDHPDCKTHLAEIEGAESEEGDAGAR